MLSDKMFFAAFLLIFFTTTTFASHGEPYTYENSEKYFHLISWHNYSQETFDLAEKENKPVMLVISAVWCYWCHVYESPDYIYNENVYPYINENFIPIFVDSDKRPDLTKQYLEGGWPSTTFLTPEKERISGYSGALPLNQLVPSFKQVVQYNSNREIKAGNTEKPELVIREVAIPTSDQLLGIENSYLQSATNYLDPEYGGFGYGQKFPQGLTEDFMLTAYDTTNDSWLLSAVKLSAESQETKNLSLYKLSDPIEGGYHRYGTTRSWSPPHYEKMLYDNARQISMLSHLYSISKDENYSKLSYSTINYVFSHFGKDKIGFAGSQDADEEYYKLTEAQRMNRTAPYIDESRYSNWNGETFYALFIASKRLHNGSLKTESTDRFKPLLAKVNSENGILHYYSIEKDNASLDGQLDDNAFILLASITAYEETNDTYFLEQSKKIADYSLDGLYDWSSAGFFERHSTDTGIYTKDELLLTSKPAFGNGAMALGMLKLFDATKNPIYLDAGLKTISAVNSAALDDGYYLAEAARYATTNNLTDRWASLEPQIKQLENNYRANFFLYKADGSASMVKPDFSKAALTALPTTNFLLLLPIAILAGLLSFLSPCCFSLIPAYFAHTLKTKEKIFMNSIGFFIGLGLLVMVLGAAAAFIGSFTVNQDKQLFGQVAGVVMVALGFLTVLGKGFSGLQITSKPPANFHDSITFGALFGLGWSPCMGPILLSLFALAANASTLMEGAVLLLAYALGLSIPLLLLSLHFERLDRDGLVWRMIKGREFSVNVFGKEFHAHSTSLISGALLITIGLLMALGYLYAFNSLTPQWIQKLEGDLLNFLT
jgi:hypothetical protein